MTAGHQMPQLCEQLVAVTILSSSVQRLLSTGALRSRSDACECEPGAQEKIGQAVLTPKTGPAEVCRTMW